MSSKAKRFIFSSSLFLSLFAFLLFSLAPLFDSPSPSTSVAVSRPVSHPVSSPLTFTKRLPRQSTLEEVLLEEGFDIEEIQRLTRDVRPVYDLNRVRAGQRLTIERLSDGTFKNLRYDISDEEYLLVQQEKGHYVATRRPYEFQVSVEEIYARIYNSLYETLLSNGEDNELFVRLWSILKWDVDFLAVQPEDSFKVILEKKYLDGEFATYGKILAVQFRCRDKNFYGFLFRDPKTWETKYYDEEGKAVRKALLRVPFRFNPRVSSRFSRSRYHPILKRRLPHLGVDYAAPAGTTVVASGNGKVIFAGTKGGYGKLVQIRHSGDLATSYAHLSRIYVRLGQRVKQGERIGRVGSTGLATGPHLDYRIKQRGKFINPRDQMSYHSDEAPVDKRYWQEFLAVRNAFRNRLESIPETKPYLNRIYQGG